MRSVQKSSKNYALKQFIPVTRHAEFCLFCTEGRKSGQNTRYCLSTCMKHFHWEPVFINMHITNYRHVCCVCYSTIRTWPLKSDPFIQETPASHLELEAHYSLRIILILYLKNGPQFCHHRPFPYSFFP